MTPEAQRIKIAEACGWKFHTHQDSDVPQWHDASGKVRHGFELPDYLHSLDAMHEAEKVLNEVKAVQFCNWLHTVVRDRSPVLEVTEYLKIHATAAQRAEAFLRTLNLWDDSK